MISFLPGIFIIFSFILYFLVISWAILFRGERSRDNIRMSALINTAQLITIFSITSIFPFNNPVYFLILLLFINIASYFIYSFPHSTKTRLAWTIYFMSISIILFTLFLLVESEYLPLIYFLTPPLFIAPQFFFIFRKRVYLEKYLRLQTTIFLSLLALIPLLHFISNSIALATYNITIPRHSLFIIPILGIILIFTARKKTIFLSTGLNTSTLLIAAGVVIPFTVLTVSFRPIGLFFHTTLPLSLITPITALSVYFIFNLIALGATITTLYIDTTLYGKRKKFAKTTQTMRTNIEKTTTVKELHELFVTTLFQTFPPLSTVRFFLLENSNAEDDFLAPDRLAMEALSAELLCKKDALYALKNSPGTSATLNEILQEHNADILFPFRKYGSLCGFYFINGRMNEIDWDYIASLLTIVSSRQGHIILFNKLMGQEKKLQDRRYLYETGKMISVIAHELRTPLTSIMFNLDIILEEMETKKAPDPEYLEISRKELQRLNNTVEKMLTYGRVTTLEPTAGTFNNFSNDIKAILHFPDTDFSVSFLSSLAEYYIDWDRLKTIVINLLTNSYQALEGRENKKITLTIQEKGSFVIIHVIDNGSGIPLDKQKQIFEPFVSTKKEGNGLGLAICEKITRLMGGGIRLQASHAGHTDFHVWIQKNQKITEGE